MKRILKYSLVVMLLGSMISGCKIEKDYAVKSDWVYVNNSSQSIRIEGVEVFDIEISMEYTLSYDSEGPETVTENDYVAPFKSGTTKVIAREREFTDTKITDRENYIATKVSNRYYRFTYTFTDADFPEE